MINYNLTGDALLHCLKISNSKVLVVDEDAGCRQRVEECRERIEQELGPDGDVFYNCMPLYHGTGGVLATGCMVSGMTLAIGRKFSTSGFWDEIRESGATAFVYVGETARYLLSAPPSPRDKDHKVRLMHGNGMRPDVWKRFQERFGVTDVMEFFNSTEGVFTLNNYSRNDHFADAVGHHGAIFRAVFKNTYVPVKLDYDTGEIWRHPETGFAQRQPYEEGGEMLVKVPDENQFKGYWHAPEATANKYARDVFETGDLYYRSGDALRRSSDGKWFFMDRLGDTFRWKGENCTDRASFDFKAFLSHSQKLLPKYAVPLFLRFVQDDQAHTMHNNKQNKTQLRREGVDPEKVSRGTAGAKDTLYWLPPRGNTYESFGEAEWHSIVAGKAKL
ncbi:unnamed protein product [Aureobasidium uvarum]|uniref:AMP-dependent synthetase/ligase domain-containing protein n=1 Tax=Aureobasidium uvarum TaxID=2773716 RepID=A0A9N8PUD7_9PEZI|nr:unnamed protein product [Aureobasidium uvarum]